MGRSVSHHLTQKIKHSIVEVWHHEVNMNMKHMKHLLRQTLAKNYICASCKNQFSIYRR